MTSKSSRPARRARPTSPAARVTRNGLCTRSGTHEVPQDPPARPRGQDGGRVRGLGALDGGADDQETAAGGGGGRVTAAEKGLVFVAYGLGLVVGFLTGLV